MSLKDRLATPPAKHTPVRSALEIWFRSLPEDEKAAVLAAATSPAWQHVELLPELVAEGAPEVSASTLGVWRRSKGWKSA